MTYITDNRGAYMILKIEPQEYNETEWIRKQSNLRTRQISAKLDKINTAINAINTAYEDVVELYQKTAYEHDDLADIVLARIARKYGHIFDVWGVFISEDIIAVKDITTRCNRFREKIMNKTDIKTTRSIDTDK